MWKATERWKCPLSNHSLQISIGVYWVVYGILHKLHNLTSSLHILFDFSFIKPPPLCWFLICYKLLTRGNTLLIEDQTNGIERALDFSDLLLLFFLLSFFEFEFFNSVLKMNNSILLKYQTLTQVLWKRKNQIINYYGHSGIYMYCSFLPNDSWKHFGLFYEWVSLWSPPTTYTWRVKMVNCALRWVHASTLHTLLRICKLNTYGRRLKE